MHKHILWWKNNNHGRGQVVWKTPTTDYVWALSLLILRPLHNTAFWSTMATHVPTYNQHVAVLVVALMKILPRSVYSWTSTCPATWIELASDMPSSFGLLKRPSDRLSVKFVWHLDFFLPPPGFLNLFQDIFNYDCTHTKQKSKWKLIAVHHGLIHM